MNVQRKPFKFRIIVFILFSGLLGAMVWLSVPSDQGVYDRFFRMRPPRQPEPGIVLWAMDETTLAKYGKWPFLPEDMELLADFIAKASPARVLVDGPTFDLENTGRIPSRIPILDVRELLGALTPDSDGVYRSFPATTSQGTPLAAVFGNSFPVDPADADNRPVRVNFSGPGIRYPTVQLFKIIQEEFRTEIFTGQTILIGDISRDSEHGLLTPFWPQDGAMPRIEYLAEALSTLAGGIRITPVPYHLNLVFPWLFALGLFFLGFRLSVFHELLFWASGLFALFAVQYLLFARLDLSGRVWPQAIFLLVLANSSLVLRLAGIKTGTEELISSFSFRSANLTFLPSASPGDEIWEDFARLGAIYLDCDFQAFFRVNPKNQEVDSIHHAGRKSPDPYWVHSDLGSSPFAELSRRSNPIETPLPGMAESGAAKISILTPIRFNGALYGFWGLMREKSFGAVQKHSLHRIISHLADEMGRRLALQKDLAEPQEPLMDRLAREPIEGRIQGLDDLVRTFERNERFFSYAFSNMPDGIVIFNLSGGILYFNDPAQKGLRRFSLAVTDPDFFETLRVLSRSREEIFRTRLISLLSGSEIMNFEAGTPAGQVWSVSVYPIIDQQTGHPAALIAKMTDVTDMVQQRNMRTKVIHAFFGALKALIRQTSQSLSSQDVAAAFTGARRPLLDALKGQMGGILHLLARFEKQLEGQFAGDLTVIGPMNIAVLIREIVSSKADAAESEDIRLDLNLPGEDLLVMGNRSVLSHVVEYLIGMSISHSMEGSDIWISAEEKNDQILITIADSGIGFPSDYTQGLGIRTELGEIESALEHIGGRFRADSNLGRGARFEIAMPKVI